MREGFGGMDFCCQVQGTAQGHELVADFLQLAFRHGLGHDARSGLKIQAVAFAQKGANDNGLIEGAVEAQVANAAAVKTAVLVFVFVDQLHGPVLGCARERTRREGISHQLDRRDVRVDLARHRRDEVDHVGEILNFLEYIHLDLRTVAAEVIAGEVHEHDVLGVFLGVVKEFARHVLVLLVVAGAAKSARNGVHRGRAVVDQQLRLGAGAHELEAAVVAIEEVGRGIHRAQAAVDIELIAGKCLAVLPRKHDLKHVAELAVLNPLADHVEVVLVFEVGAFLAFGPEGELWQAVVIEQGFQPVELTALLTKAVLQQVQLIVKMVDHNDIAVEVVEDIRHLPRLIGIGLYVDVLKIPDPVVGLVAKQTIVGKFEVQGLRLKAVHESLQETGHIAVFGDGRRFC